MRGARHQTDQRLHPQFTVRLLDPRATVVSISQPAAERRSGPQAWPKSGRLRGQLSGAARKVRMGHRARAGGASGRGDAHE